MQDLEKLVKNKGEEILTRLEKNNKASLFSKDYWYGRIMDWSMKNESFKTQMFRFVDVLPTLKTNAQVAEHLKEYFTESGEELPSVFNLGLGLGSLAPGLLASGIKKNITQMAEMFIAGSNAEKGLIALKEARKNKLAFTLDILGEATLSETEALSYLKNYQDLIQFLATESQTWKEDLQLDRDYWGSIPKVNVSVKLSALYSQINVKAWQHTKDALKQRLRELLLLGKRCGVFINLDMEHYEIKNLTLEVFKELLLEPELKDYPFFGCVIQAYLRDSLADLNSLIHYITLERKTPITIRLVKGAYWDSEFIHAEQNNWPLPVFRNKAQTDANFEACTKLLLENYKVIRLALASHNVRSISFALAEAERLGTPQNAFEIQMLFGMADPIKKSLIDMGYRVREYAPIGELLPGMAYLVRRLLENTSNESWLKGKFSDGKSNEELLMDPLKNIPQNFVESRPTPQFVNEKLLDFTDPLEREKVSQAILELQKSLPLTIYPVLNHQSQKHLQNTYKRFSPNQKGQLLYEIYLATHTEAEQSVQEAKMAFTTWSKTKIEERARLLESVASLMQKARYKLIAEQVIEVGKPWDEADADVAEAIDFLNYYARDMRTKGRPQKQGWVMGESSYYSYIPRGVNLVIAPWNFPLAILTGMVGASLVTGNTCIMKPAEQSTGVASTLMNLFIEAGVPKGVLQFLPGIGEEVGAYLVEHPQIASVLFTGSKEVGLEILKKSSQVKPGQKLVKRSVIEMGGKNAIIIDEDADLDEAVGEVLYSAFGFGGQKCSACSRVIVLSSILDSFTERLVEAAKSLVVTSSLDPVGYYGPVVDEEAFARIEALATEFKLQHDLAFEGVAPSEGYFVPPRIFKNVKPQSKLAQEEIFGPILAIIPAQDLTEAIQIANQVEYALTGGFFSRSPKNIERVKSELECGNLYINRGITGAMVDRHPFGGFKLSGVGSKTGGPDYLLQFMEPQVITENTMRRGFAPKD